MVAAMIACSGARCVMGAARGCVGSSRNVARSLSSPVRAETHYQLFMTRLLQLRQDPISEF
jgi:hypothetical protein